MILFSESEVIGLCFIVWMIGMFGGYKIAKDRYQKEIKNV